MPLLRSLDERGEKVEWNPEPGWVLSAVLDVRMCVARCRQPEMGFIFKGLKRDRDPGSQGWSQAWRRLWEFSTAACQGTEPYAAETVHPEVQPLAKSPCGTFSLRAESTSVTV